MRAQACTRTWGGSASAGAGAPGFEGRHTLGYVAQGNCLKNAAAEQVCGRLRDEFFRGRDRETFEEFKVGLDAYTVRWSTVRRWIRPKGLIPAEFQERALRRAA